MSRLCINLCTRGRPEVLSKTIERTLQSIALPDTIFMVSADEDDEETRKELEKWGSSISPSVRPREDEMGSKYNRALSEHPEAGVICNLSDYTPFTTKGFDENIVLAAQRFPDGIGVVVNDKRNASFSDIYAVTRPMCDLLGFYFPPFFPYWFIDHWIEDLATLVDRKWRVDAQIEYVQGKSRTQGIRELTFWSTFYDMGVVLRHAQAEKILRALDEPEWRKVMVRSRWPLVDYCSRWINDGVRGRAFELEAWSGAGLPDERYRRVRYAAAVQMQVWIMQMEMQGGGIEPALRSPRVPQSEVPSLPIGAP